MQLRRDLADSWAPTGRFSFDGSTSDLALQLYTGFQTGEWISQLSLDSIPDTVTSRLSDVNVAFEDLDGYAQRAVLWDSGFAVTSDNDVKQIKTLNGLSMAEIALTLEEYEATSCIAFDCIQPDGTTSYNNKDCPGTTMLTGVKCVVEEFEMDNQNLFMWSIGGEPSTTPEIELVKHTWTVEGDDYIVYAVHTQSASTEREYGDCPLTERYGYLNIPCYGADLVPSSEEVTEPTPTDWVTSWMETYSTAATSSSTGGSDSSHSSSMSGINSYPEYEVDDGSTGSGGGNPGTNVALLGGAVGGGLCLLLVVVLVGCFVAGRRRKRSGLGTDRSPEGVDHVAMITPHDDCERRPTVSMHPRQEFAAHPPRIQEQTRQSAPGPMVQAMPYQVNVRAFGSEVAAPPSYEEVIRISRSSNQSAPVPVNVEKIRGLGTDNALQVLVADPNIHRRRVPLDQLQVQRQLPMTTLQTDSFIANHNSQKVLVKRLAPGQSVNVPAFEDLAFEIQQRSHLNHPNLVQFVGAGWTSALDLTMVVEFLSQGTLRAYLDRNKTRMSTWTTQKTSITAGIARALAYLHRQTPAYIYHDCSANNVLLTDNFEPKLANCGSTETSPSIGAKQRSRQAFWIAPEVLKGAGYSPAADIFSFGVLLTELDTRQTPYFDARTVNGSNLDQDAILALVTEGRLRPSFSAECPNFIRQLGVACCQHDPEKRLTAQQIVQLLEGK